VGIPAKLNACSEGSRTARVTRADATKVLEYNDRLLSGTPIGRIVGGEAMKFGWQRLNAEYAKQSSRTRSRTLVARATAGR
jgi:hypothetical protein